MAVKPGPRILSKGCKSRVAIPLFSTAPYRREYIWRFFLPAGKSAPPRLVQKYCSKVPCSLVLVYKQPSFCIQFQLECGADNRRAFTFFPPLLLRTLLDVFAYSVCSSHLAPCCFFPLYFYFGLLFRVYACTTYIFLALSRFK